MIFPSRPGGSSPGTITVLRLGQTQLQSHRPGSTAVSVRHDRYTWRAPRDIPGPLPSDRSVRFDVFTAADGNRRFVPCPEDGLDGYVARAFQYGHSLLARDRNFDWNRWCDYLFGKHAYDRLQRVQERIKRTFNASESLDITKAVRTLMGHVSVLPDELGQTTAGAGNRWSAGRLLLEGRQAAIEYGVMDPSDADAITHGLLAAARLNPLRIDKREEVSALMRMALYDFSQVESRASDAQQEEVLQRFHDLIRKHLHEDREQFRRWFAGGSSNLVKAIANNCGRTGQKLPQGVVKRALHDLGWRGYQMVGECLEAFAQAFARALPRPGTPQELAYLEAMYCRQDYLGGLPLVLVMERQPQIQPAVIQIWENADDTEMIGVLHQVLRYYTEMVAVRRHADRLAKENAAGRCPKELPLEEGMSTVEANCPSPNEVFRHLLERRGIRCSQCDQYPRGRLVDDNFQPGSPIQLDVQCDVHGPVDTVEITWEEMESIRTLFEDEHRASLYRSDRRRRSQYATPEGD